ncbi:hypothetical protein N7478_010442 [Penicillium angulare]|uniref:uncharacterized protein n=1 Tax=Penicillium angulare TaxID=116970 RepID=UPI00254169C5|nr:uncharacterized protein N7478_010442 [Penicillium angulare]KAJ5267634.1 hypothetical protein N7478_010442 [Penicillium angulare]
MTGRMQWDDAAKCILLVKILEIHEISVDCQKIADSWRKYTHSHGALRGIYHSFTFEKEMTIVILAEGGVKPTARAIREAIFKIRRETLGTKADGGQGTPTTPKSSAKKPRSKITKSTVGVDGSPSERRRKRNVSGASAKKISEDAAAEGNDGDDDLTTFKSEYETLEDFDLPGELKEEDLAPFDTEMVNNGGGF